jgi:hypothetical protein
MDLIYAARYTEICDYRWQDFSDNNLELPAGIWHVDTASIPQFFKRIQMSGNGSRRYIVVSPSCDFGVCLQKYNHPCRDLEKWLSLQITERHGYNDLQMRARINRERCKESDTYSIKCWSYTETTFDKIPDNVVRWFLCNCYVNDDRLIPIPFGIAGNKNDLDSAYKIYNYKFTELRNKLLYVNFQFYNTDRFRIYQHFNRPFYEYLVTCKHQVSFDEYLNDLATHQFVLCPEGNGYDCYRTLETVYMGAIPIIQSKPPCFLPYNQDKYPIYVIDNFYQVDPLLLTNTYNETIKHMGQDATELKWSYWKNRILKCRSEL